MFMFYPDFATLPQIHVEPLQHFVSTFIEFCMVEASVTDGRGMPILAQGLPLKIADPFDYEGGT